MSSNIFIQTYNPYAFEVEKETGIPAVAILAQKAHESDWGRKAIGNNISGVKYKEGDWGYKEVLTTEHSKNPDAFKDKKIQSRVYDEKTGVYVFKLWDKFADYPTPKECFSAHARLLLTKRYRPALRWKYSPKRYLIATWRAGYATDVYYGYKMIGGYCKYDKKTYYSIVDSVTRRLKKIENDKNIGVPGEENLKPVKQEQTGYRDNVLTGMERIGNISSRLVGPSANRLKLFNKTEKEVNEGLRYKFKIKISIDKIIKFLKGEKK
jgi:flagellum-specific peptidoglycan hydrolase FlgJ